MVAQTPLANALMHPERDVQGQVPRPFTIQQVLELDILRAATVDVVAGRESLARVVRWAFASEAVDVARFLQGGELVLTTGANLGDAASQRAYIADLVRAGAAGVVLASVGHHPLTASRVLVADATRHRLPVIALTSEVRFVELTYAIHASIFLEDHDVLRRLCALDDDLRDLLVRRSPPATLATYLAGVIDGPVVLENAAHQVVEFAGYSAPLSSLLETWTLHTRMDHGPDMATCVLEPIVLRDGVWGRIHAPIGRQADQFTSLAVQRVARATAIVLGSGRLDRRSAHGIESPRSHVLSQLLRGAYVLPGERRERLRAAGLDILGGRAGAIAVEILACRPDRATALAHERRNGDVQEAAMTSLVAAAHRASCSALVTDDDGIVLGLVVVPERLNYRDAMNAIASDVAATLTRDGTLVTAIGVSDPVVDRSEVVALGEAKDASQTARPEGGSSNIVHFEDCGLDVLLARLAAGPELAHFVESEIGPLLQHDAMKSVKLISTVDTYLRSGCSKARTAVALGIERRSVYHRLYKVESLLSGRHLDDPETCVRLAVAVRGWEFLRRRVLPVG